ncbi:hypothetical protein PMG11_09199 [Penicillium brasilianum]|uniref:Histidine-specific methyltransferase SAM-dependent domain-containing protein n=1 Tax=Penicillium brasilianum TaxID=104259 RepID=A0A0F7TYY2_PENBI|nr:hypothetical protein PMG11_09199 [Penicillium brasilianum]
MVPVTQSNTMAPILPEPISVLQDIRTSYDSVDLKSCVIAGLTSEPKSMPDLLLWDEQGMRNFNSWIQHQDYYPRSSELEIIHKYQDEIAQSLPSTLVLVELGCGSLYKTKSILSALACANRTVHYYALDVSEGALSDSLEELQTEFADRPAIKISGLLGTYEDCVKWLTDGASPCGLPSSTVCFLWLGNSVTNLGLSDASALISKFRNVCIGLDLQCSFLLTADCCTSDERLMKAYEPINGPSHTFMHHGLKTANEVLGWNVFDEKIWRCTVERDLDQNELIFRYRPAVNVSLDIGSTVVHVQKNEGIQITRSGKWSEKQMGWIADRSGFRIEHIWRDLKRNYCLYFLL